MDNTISLTFKRARAHYQPFMDLADSNPEALRKIVDKIGYTPDCVYQVLNCFISDKDPDFKWVQKFAFASFRVKDGYVVAFVNAMFKDPEYTEDFEFDHSFDNGCASSGYWCEVHLDMDKPGIFRTVTRRLSPYGKQLKERAAAEDAYYNSLP